MDGSIGNDGDGGDEREWTAASATVETTAVIKDRAEVYEEVRGEAAPATMATAVRNLTGVDGGVGKDAAEEKGNGSCGINSEDPRRNLPSRWRTPASSGGSTPPEVSWVRGGSLPSLPPL